LDYLSLRRLALRKAGVADSALGQEKEEDNRYIGEANLLPAEIRADLFENLPLGFIEEGNNEVSVSDVTKELERISQMVDSATYDLVPKSVWEETVERVQTQGIELLDIHRDMYLAAIEEGRTREREYDMTSHLTGDALARARAMTPEKMQRLSLFRVQKFFEKIGECKKALVDWSYEGSSSSSASSSDSSDADALPENWPFTLPLNVGDQVEADLGGAFFPATVTKVAGAKYDVKFFDGDVMNGLDRDMIKLLTPTAPPANGGGESSNSGEDPPPGLTKKELKRWRKKQEKQRNKKGF
jgi:hypothetical protein